MGVEEHCFLCRGVVVPLVQGCQVGGGKLPLAYRVGTARGEACQLLFTGDGEPELDDVDARVHQHTLQVGNFAHKFEVLCLGAVTHHALNTGTVVPGAVHQDDFAAGGQVLDVTLEVPLGLLDVGRLLQRHNASATGVQVLGEALDGAALTCCVAAFEDNQNLLTGGLRPELQLQQLNLQGALFLLVCLTAELGVVGVTLLPCLRGFVVLLVLAEGAGEGSHFVQLCRVVFDNGGAACLGLQGFLDGLFLLRAAVCVCPFCGVLVGFSLRSLHCLLCGLGGGILLCHECSFLPVCFDSLTLPAGTKCTKRNS